MHLFTAALALLAATSASASVTCLKVGTPALAQWTNAAKQSCTYIGIVGSNFGPNPVNGGEYSCNGRCGAGCSGAALGNAYTQDCWSHDICSFFNNATNGAFDPNCGSAFVAAMDDFALGKLEGCSQTNPTLAPSPPSGKPTCNSINSGARDIIFVQPGGQFHKLPDS